MFRGLRLRRAPAFATPTLPSVFVLSVKAKRWATVLGALTVVGLTLGAMRSAEAIWMPGACPETPPNAVFHPLTGDPLASVWVRPNLSPTTLTWAWACIDGGPTVGAHSVGTAGYHWANTTGAGYAQHLVVCLDHTSINCEDYWTGAAVTGVAAGPGGGGAEVCAGSDAVTSSPLCEEVRYTTTGPTPPATVHTGPPPTSGGADCGPTVNGACTLKEVTVTAGGTTVGATATGVVTQPAGATVPDVTVCINRTGLESPHINTSRTC